jgi:Toastrack DUF4097
MQPPARARACLFASLIGPFGLSACVVHVESEGRSETVEKRFTVTDSPNVRLSTFDGRIEVRGWDRPEVFVRVEKRGATEELLKQISIVAEQNGNEIKVEATYPHDKGWTTGIGRYASRSARIVANVPARLTLYAESGDGLLVADALDGRIELETEDGSITGTSLRGAIRVHTGDGGVKLENIDGECDASSADGGITLKGRLASLRASSGDGGIIVKAMDGSAMTGEWEVSTGDGAVLLVLPAMFDAVLDARTSGGRIHAEGLPSTEGAGERDRRDDSESLRAEIGAGGHRLRIHTGDGSITVRRYAPPQTGSQ